MEMKVFNNSEELAVVNPFEVSILPFLLECRDKGRAHVSQDARDSILAINNSEKTASFCALYDSESVALARRFARIEGDIYVNEDLNYSNYLNLPLIEHFTESLCVDETLSKCRLALAAIVFDWQRFEERAALLSQAGYPAFKYSSKHCDKRILELKRLSNIVASDDLPFCIPCLSTWRTQENEWQHLGRSANGLLGLVMLTCLPQSKFHDEVMFIRITHVAECCFIGACKALVRASEIIDNVDENEICDLVKQANTFVSILLFAFTKIFRTLPIENFYHGFRPETGGSSAIQSKNYQLLDGIIRGYSKAKRDALAQQPLVFDVFENENQKLMGKLIATAKQDSKWNKESVGELEYYLLSIRRNFCSWQKFHLGIARTYIPVSVQGTGGMGVDYLKNTISNIDGMDKRTLDNKSEIQIRDVQFSKTEPGTRVSSPLFWIQLTGFRVQESDRKAKVPLLTTLIKLLSSSIDADIKVFDSNKLLGGLRVDTAKTGEHFVGENGSLLACRTEEQVIRDAKGIFFGVVSGGSNRALLSGSLFDQVEIDSLEISVVFNPFNSEQEVKSKIGKVTRKFRPHVDSMILVSEHSCVSI